MDDFNIPLGQKVVRGPLLFNAFRNLVSRRWGLLRRLPAGFLAKGQGHEFSGFFSAERTQRHPIGPANRNYRRSEGSNA